MKKPIKSSRVRLAEIVGRWKAAGVSDNEIISRLSAALLAGCANLTGWLAAWEAEL